MAKLQATTKKKTQAKAHNSTIVQLFDTTEYDVFTLSTRNRPINPGKVHDFIKKFKEGKNFMKEFPGIVDDDFTILDGQHRFEACKALGIPFYYRAADKLTLKNVIEVQTNAGWGTMDFLHAFVQQGKQDYIILHRFVQKYEISSSIAAMILGNKEGSNDALGKLGFYDGSYTVTNETNSHVLMERICAFYAGGFSKAKSRGFVLALRKCMKHPKYNHKQMIEKFEKFGSSILKPQTDIENYIRALEYLYNYRQPESHKIRFL